ncbi:5'-nucleotidase, lipoprotein e(P4) family [Streptococcus hillyeri]|uniref:5'-nucleotidase, lipoprotein e(P4) family n=1 Tax=Streptococcus hillyeri TaxID=2282420 RepID=A0A3L9DRA8_9STRE|nr:5'-nucleotidase, lipoprotein e(P4) family [Streptococcus hillyeri]RLY02533.1 5'-nucleotidase, lipoprotein e(P4) family [Streptococcus hillyeri]
MRSNKKTINLLCLSLAAFLLVGCNKTSSQSSQPTKNEPEKIETVQYTDEQLRSAENTLSVAWYQQSAEAKALYLQGYQVATERLKGLLGQPTEKPYSIVLDIDETVLDNSPYQAKNVLEGTAFTPESWDIWVQKKAAKPVAGAKDFLQFADQNGVQIYYISDRQESQIDATMENLEKEGLPVQGRDHFLFLADGMKSKESRRQKVQETTNLVMLFGDNLVDFAEFSKSSKEDREQLLDQLHLEFGSKFIIFPNPMYGSWESTIYGGQKLDAKGQREARLKALESFE